jgi:salicylate hydroxylase
LLLVDVGISFSSLARPCLASLAVAGFSMAIGLALSGHAVRVLERNSTLGKPPGGIRLPPNVTKILVQWGLEDELRRRGSLVREGSHLWECKLLFCVRHSLQPLSYCSLLKPGETGNLVGYLEWAEPVIQESGAKFYMMRVCSIRCVRSDASSRINTV